MYHVDTGFKIAYLVFT